MAARLLRARRRPGRPRADLHADDPRGGVRDARLRAHRRDPLGGVRRLRQRAASPAASTTPQPKVIVSADAGSRARQGGAVQAAARRGDPPRRRTSRRACCWSTAASSRCRAWPGAIDDYAALRARHLDAAGARAPGSMPTHPSYTLYTSGTTGKPKGVQRDTGGYAVALAARMKHIFCGAPGETYFSHQRHRLGRRPQLHRLRPADRRHGDDHVRGPAGAPRRRHLVAAGREVQGHA